MEKGVREMRVIIIQTIVVIETDDHREEPVRGESGLAEAFQTYQKLRPLMLEQQDEQRENVTQ